jgi:hypothetical protein
MKKALAFFMVLGLASVSMFAADPAPAAVTIGAWGRGVFIPVANSGASGEKSASLNQASWGGNPRIGFNVVGNSANVGFEVDLVADPVGATQTPTITLTNGAGATAKSSAIKTSYLGFGDQQKIWVKPIDMVTVQLGAIYDDTLRGSESFGSFNWVRAMGSWTGDSAIFDRLGESMSGLGNVEISIAPTKALYTAVYLNGVGDGNGPSHTSILANNAQIAAGYTIDGIGQIRAQYIGKATYDAVNDKTVNGDSQFQAAFKITAVKDLTADVGIKMHINSTVSDTSTGDLEATKNIAAGVDYNVAGATIHGLITYAIKKDSDVSGGMEIGLGADYGLANGIGLVGDIRYFNKNGSGATNDSGDAVAKTNFLVGVTKGFSNGLIGIGVQVSSAANTGYCIPVRMEYWF